jgi:hypothetical protein
MPEATSVLEVITQEFARLKQMAERAVAQLSDEQLQARLDDDANSIAVIMKHMAGNLRSRFTDFLSSDGEKPWRGRDGEFVEEPLSRSELLSRWESGWAVLFDALAGLSDADLQRVVSVRGQTMSALAAINRQTSHHAYHVGQILLLARHFKGPGWQYITIPRGQSEQFNSRMRDQPGRSAGA